MSTVMEMPRVAEPRDVELLRDLHSALRHFNAGAQQREHHAREDRDAMDHIRGLADRAARAMMEAWTSYLTRVEQAWSPQPPAAARSLAADLREFLARSIENAPIGGVGVPTIRFADVRAAIAARGDEVLAQISACIDQALEREEKDRAWRRRRVDFVAELYERPETRDIMRGFDKLEAAAGDAFEASIRHSFVQVLHRVLTWCAEAGRPYAFRSLPSDPQNALYDFRAMREEWRASRP